MIIAVMSDSHDNIWMLRNALAIIKEKNADMIIHCGDFIAPFMLKELNKADISVHGVFGNNDGDQHLLTKFSLTSFTNIKFYSPIGHININGFDIGFVHHNITGEALAATNKYKLVCYGHSHTHIIKNTGQTIILNPGEIMGKDGYPGFCFFDTDTSEIQRVELKKSTNLG